MSDDGIYIIGAGMHAFGRHDGVSGLDMGSTRCAPAWPTPDSSGPTSTPPSGAATSLESRTRWSPVSG